MLQNQVPPPALPAIAAYRSKHKKQKKSNIQTKKFIIFLITKRIGGGKRALQAQC